MTHAGEALERLVDIMRRLRGPDGCPWDQKQTLESLKSDLIEEAYEVIDAIESGDCSSLEEELGDLLLQIVFQSQICEENGHFRFSDVAKGIADKLERRHPHVFGDVSLSDSDEVLQQWDEIKKKEKKDQGKPTSIIAGIPRHLPALQKAHQIQKRVARSGFDWDNVDDVLKKLHEEIEEVQEAVQRNHEADIRAELGDLLFSVVNLSRFLGHNPEELLNHNIKKFVGRFELVEEKVKAAGKPFAECTLEELDRYWDEVKAEE